jgi:hypothetical protein
MKKSILTILILILANLAAKAQNASASGSQQVDLVLGNVIDITFNATGTATGTAINLPFNTTANYVNGVTSTAQSLRVRSNQPFNVTAKTTSANFTYTGSYTTGTTMPVNGVLKLMVTANTTGGSIATPFSSTAYSTLSATDQNLIINGSYGNNQQFSVQYQAIPTLAYPAATYTTTVVYTATQQ